MEWGVPSGVGVFDACFARYRSGIPRAAARLCEALRPLIEACVQRGLTAREELVSRLPEKYAAVVRLCGFEELARGLGSANRV